MKPTTPHDPFDDQIAAALHGDLTLAERTQFESRLNTDPAARAAYQEAQAMHDLLDRTHKNAQPDSDFEQRMVSGVRRKIQHEPARETKWDSLIVLWRGLRKIPIPHLGLSEIIVVLVIIAVLSGVALGPITNGIKQANAGQVRGVFSTITSQLSMASDNESLQPPPPVIQNGATPGEVQRRITAIDQSEARLRAQLQQAPDNKPLADHLARLEQQKVRLASAARQPQLVLNNHAVDRNGFAEADKKKITLGDSNIYSGGTVATAGQLVVSKGSAATVAPPATTSAPTAPIAAPSSIASASGQSAQSDFNVRAAKIALAQIPDATPSSPAAGKDGTKSLEPAAIDDRKLIRNAQLDLEVKSFQNTVDQVTAMAKSAGGYVDTSTSQRGGNGKLQGTVSVKVLPQNLDDFLLKLRDLGEVKNQSVSTDDVTKEYFDTQARLENSRKMEVQLQDLLKRENGKVSDLLAVERELGRVRGEIEGMQGQLKLYDFQVQYATVTMQIAEKDLKKAAAYLLKEQDEFSLFATDVEGTFQKARTAADTYKGQVLVANLIHNSGSDVSAMLVVSVPPDQIEPFLAEVRGMGRVANFTRDTKRVSQDGGDSNQPADETLTEKDKIMVNISIRSDDETRKQVALTVVTKAVDDALEQAKAAALANTGVEILSSSLNKAPEGQSTAQLSVRVPGKGYTVLIESFRALGRTASLSIQRNDNSGPGASGDDAPVIVSLSLTDDDTPVQNTDMAVAVDDVDGQSQQIKKAAGESGVEVKASSFERQPDGTELAQMTLRMPMGKYAKFLETLKAAGKVESLSVNRNDRPDQTRSDDTAPAEIALQLHNVRGIVADNDGIWPTLRRTFGEGLSALFGSVRVIGVIVAFAIPWIVTLGLIAWASRRIYVWRKR